jgi:FKBP-type peptidyl-prolyl cis-trans isomerase 2
MYWRDKMMKIQKILITALLLTVFAAPLAAEKAPAEEGASIVRDKTVKIHYIMKVDGEVLEDTYSGGPFEYIHGSDGMIIGVQRNLTGLKTGDKRTFTVAPLEGFGVVDPEREQEIHKKDLPPGDIRAGDVLVIETEKGNLSAVVKEVRSETVVFDLNHPLAGKELEFEVEVISVS